MNLLALKTVMDAYQGVYKDGTNNTRDYSRFSGIFFLSRTVVIILMSVMDSGSYNYFSLRYFRLDSHPYHSSISPSKVTSLLHHGLPFHLLTCCNRLGYQCTTNKDRLCG